MIEKTTSREKTLEDYIYELGQKELTHDYEAETKRILAMFKEHETNTYNAHEQEKINMRKRMENMEIVIYALIDRLRCIDSSFWESKRSE